MNPAPQSGICEHNAAHKPEARGKADEERNDKRRDVRADGHKTKINHFFLKDVIVADEVQHNVKQGVASAACQVPKGLQINKFPERRIKLVYNGYDEILGHF